MDYKHVVTSFLRSDEKILILRRSAKVGTYQGRWAGVSGYLEPGEDPLQRARSEIQEEFGLDSGQIDFLRSGEVLRAFDEESNIVWAVHPFLFGIQSQSLRLDWEHTEYEWIDSNKLSSYETVPNLKETLERVYWDLTSPSSAISKVLRSVDDLARDRVHGASFLGRQALELIIDAVRVSDATSIDDLFRDVLIVFSRLRKAQPGMVNIRNLTGKVLRQIDQLRRSSLTVDQFRGLALSLTQEVISEAERSSEDASRNAVKILPEEGNVLTHSYSSTVKRTLELGMKSGRKLQVYVTESYPGLEGKQLAKDLINIGLSVKLIADSAAKSSIRGVGLVLVGADSVLRDGSLVHKAGTRSIAEAADAKEIPFYVSCETTKFSTLDFLGEIIGVPGSLFDVTPARYVSKFITEIGVVETPDVEQQIRNMLRELYP